MALPAALPRRARLTKLNGGNVRARCGNRPRGALDLGAMHDAPHGAVEGIAAMHGGAIVPQQEIPDPPAMLVGEARLRGMRPYPVEQSFRFLR